MKFKKFIIFIIILFSFTSLKAQDRDIQLNDLFNELKINNTALFPVLNPKSKKSQVKTIVFFDAEIL